MRLGEVVATSALRVQAAARPQGLEEIGEERRVIADPVEGGRAEDEVGPFVEWHGWQRDLNESHMRTKRRPEVRACGLQHVPRTVDRHELPVRQPLQQFAGQTAASAAGVDCALVATELESRDTFWPQLVCGAETLWYEEAFHSCVTRLVGMYGRFYSGRSDGTADSRTLAEHGADQDSYRRYAPLV